MEYILRVQTAFISHAHKKKNKKNLSIYFFEINSILQKLDISIKPVKKLTINNQEKQQILTKHATFLLASNSIKVLLSHLLL